MTKRLDYGNRVIVWLNDQVDSSKRPVSLDKIILGDLNKENTLTSNRANVKQKIDSENGVIIRLSRLITRDEFVIRALNKTNTGGINRVNVTK